MTIIGNESNMVLDDMINQEIDLHLGWYVHDHKKNAGKCWLLKYDPLGIEVKFELSGGFFSDQVMKTVYIPWSNVGSIEKVE